MNVKQKTLVCWIGHADLLAMAATFPEEQRKRLAGEVGGTLRSNGGDGPIRTLVMRESFDDIHLLSNYPTWVGRAFSKWLGGATKVHEVQLKDPTDYTQVFNVSDQVLSQICFSDSRGMDLCIHLSPGTPAMTAIWVLLGKSRYPARFFQTHGGRAWQTEIPFDLVVDFLPNLLRGSDTHLVGLAAKAPGEIGGFEAIVGNSRAIRVAVGRAQRAAIRDVSVLITGESGTGKEMFARAIHAASARRLKPFVAINCAAVPRDLLESELFGHKKGAFTGAFSDRAGAFEEADGGTLFLDEVGECPLEMQAKLLRVLQPLQDQGPSLRAFRRLGESKDRISNVRILAATNQHLIEAIDRREFREDLYYRLAVVVLALPSLRERKEDIKLLAASLLEQINASFRTQEPAYEDKSLSTSAKAFVLRHSWPGNVRQLFNTLVQSAVMAEGKVLEQADLAEALGETAKIEQSSPPVVSLGDGFNLTRYLESIQRELLERAMEEAKGVKTHAARLLGYANYQTLDAQLRRLGAKYTVAR